ncbi:MAG: hypothetical protein KJO23_06680 [Bacteroidia bacterium]|nr:hypothetical protein [Bacteroidia bacterium]
MKKLMIVLTLISVTCYAQQDLSQFNNVRSVVITAYWGDVHVHGTKPAHNRPFYLDGSYTNTSKLPKKLKAVSQFVSVRVSNRKLYLEVRKPEGFESVDLNLNVPQDKLVEIKLIKGGNIYAQNLKNGAEIDILNGSVRMERMGKYALVNAANGSIEVEFESVDAKMPISLITMNGGIDVKLPSNVQREVRLISRKNGYVLSDFDLESNEPITNLNSAEYSKKAISNTARINGGGSLLFLSTENGPISIKKN